MINQSNPITRASIGVDASMNASGVTFIFEYQDETTIEKYYLFTPEADKVSPDIQNIAYKRIWDNDNYSIEEMSKVLSAQRLAAKISGLIIKLQLQYQFEHLHARMEGSIVNTGKFAKKASRVNDLTMFNVIIKLMLVKHQFVRTIAIIPPKSLKKLATGNGNAKKELMITKFIEKFPNFTQIYKIDDVIDAYFLASVHWPDSKCFVKQELQ